MSLVLRRQQLFALMIVAFLTAIIATYFLLTAVAHIDVLHILSSISPNFVYPRF